MKVELSERAQRSAEQLVEKGTYPSVAAVLEATVRLLEADVRPPTHEEVAAAAAAGRADFEAGRFRDGDVFAKELRARIAEMPDSPPS